MKTQARCPLHRDRGPSLRRDRGVTLLFAMLALVAMSFAAAGLVRSSSSNSAVVGNLSFKADTAALTERGIDNAIEWLKTRTPADLQIDQPALGYYASARANLDPTGQRIDNAGRAVVDWEGNDCDSVAGNFGGCIQASAPVDVGNGRTYSYVITRLCSAEGTTEIGNSCHTTLAGAVNEDSSRGLIDQQNSQRIDDTILLQPLYRVLVRAKGGRQSTTVAEAIVEY